LLERPSGFFWAFFYGERRRGREERFSVQETARDPAGKPQKPVKIKLHRNAKVEYSWDLNGDNADEIVNTDRKLRKLLKVQ